MREGVANAYQQMLSKDSGWKADIGRLQLNFFFFFFIGNDKGIY